MGTWTIYSIGDAAFLEQIFIAVAMVTGTGDFRKAAGIALLIAVLMYFFQSLMRNAKDINVGQLLLGWLVFMCMFTPTTTVVIEDAVNGSVRVVSNVPLGMGAVGGMTSSIGYGLTSIFEQAYGYIAPGITESHFSDSLALLNKVRDAARDPRVMQAINETFPDGADYRASWDNYIRECTLRKIDLGQETADGLLSQPLPDALRFESNVYGTKLFLFNSNGNNVTCSEGFSELLNAQSMLRGYFLEDALNQALSLQAPEYGGYVNAFHHISDAFHALQLSQQDAYKYVEANILEPIYHDAVMGKYQDMQDFSSAVMINEAIQQRNVQWASEQTLFMSTIRPLQTFFEGLVYALTPLIGVLVIMGSFGLGLAAKYLQTMLWIQFWLPTLSIINLYIYTAASGELNSYNNEKFASIYSLAGMNDVLQNWVGVGAMLAASTPVIALFLVTGSTYAMMGIAGRVSGSDHVSEQITTPDVAQPGAYMASQPMHTYKQMTGGMVTDADKIVGSTSLGSAFSDSISSSEEKHSQAQQGFQQTLGRTLSSATNQSQVMQTATALGATISSSHSSGAGYVENIANDFMAKHGIDQSQKNSVMGQVALAATAGASAQAGIGAGSTGGNVSGGLDATATAKKSTETAGGDTFSKVSGFVQGYGLSNQQSADITDSVASSFNATSSSAFSHALGDEASKSLQESASQVTAAKQAYVETSQAAQSFGSSHNMKFSDLAGLMAGPNATHLGKSALSNLNDYYRSGQANQEVQASAQRKENQYRSLGMAPTLAQATARLEAMTDTTNYSTPQEQISGVRSASSIISSALGSQSNMATMNPYDNSQIQTPNIQPEQMQNEVQAATQPAQALTASNTQATGQAYGSVESAYQQGVGNLPINSVLDHNDKQLDTVKENAGWEMQHQLGNQRLQSVKNMVENAPSPTQASTHFNGWAKAADNAVKLLGVNQSSPIQFDPQDDSGLRDSVGNYKQSPEFNKVALLAEHELGLPKDQAAYFAYRASGGTDSAVRDDFIKNARNHDLSINDRDGSAIANTLEKTASVSPQLAQGYLNDLHTYNSAYSHGQRVEGKTQVPSGSGINVNIGGVSSASEPTPAVAATTPVSATEAAPTQQTEATPVHQPQPTPAVAATAPVSATEATPTQQTEATPVHQPQPMSPTTTRLSEEEIRTQEANKIATENYWRPNNQSDNTRFNYSEEPSSTTRIIPKRPDRI